MSGKTSRSSHRTLILCVLGLAVVAAGLAYCVHLGAVHTAEQEEPRTAAEFKVVSPDGQVSTDVPTAANQVSDQGRSRTLFGIITSVNSSALSVRGLDGATHRLEITSGTAFESLKGGGVAALRTGDMVVVHATLRGDGLVADLVIDSRISAGLPTG